MKAGSNHDPFGKYTNHKIQGHNNPGSLFLLPVFLLIIAGLFIPAQSTLAQSGPTIITTTPDQSNFPILSLAFKIFDVNGQPVHQLNPDHVRIIENEKEIIANDIKAIQGNVHFILAINADKILALRDSSGISNYDYLIGAINNWQHPTMPREADRWSLLVNQGKSVTQLSNVDAWHALVTDYRPNFRATQKSLNSLIASIDLARTNLDKIHTDQILLYITPVPSSKDLPMLAALTQQAIDTGLRVNIWMVGNQNDADSPSGQALVNLSRSSGGNFFLFPTPHAIPNPQGYLDAYGTYFKASYRTQIIESSTTHSCAIRWETPAQNVISAAKSFTMNVLPPQPIFLSPPININLQVGTDLSADSTPHSELQKLKVLIEYPDGHPRAIKSLQLYQDGYLVSETSSPPFGSLDWDLSNITDSRLILLQLRMEDELGLQASSVLLPINVTVIPQENTVAATKGTSRFIVILILAIIGAALSGIITWWVVRHKKSGKANHTSVVKPSTRPHTEVLMEHHPDEAKLLWLDENFTLLNKPPLWLGKHTTTIGNDPLNINIYINDPSLDAQHAKFTYHHNLGYKLCDLNSIAGCWVNFSPVPADGTVLKNRDLIHIGKVAFRFSLDYTSINE